MDRIVSFINKYTYLSPAAADFLMSNGKLQTFKKGDLFVKENETKYSIGFILEGLAAISITKNKKSIILTKLIPPNHYIVGNKHIYSRKPSLETIQFLRKSEVYVINTFKAQMAVEKFREFNLIFHILKQKDLILYNHFVHLHKLHHTERLTYFFLHFPEFFGKLTVKELMSLMSLSNSRQYYTSLKNYHINSKKS